MPRRKFSTPPVPACYMIETTERDRLKEAVDKYNEGLPFNASINDIIRLLIREFSIKQLGE